MISKSVIVGLLLLACAAAQSPAPAPQGLENGGIYLSTDFRTPITIPLGAGMRTNSTTLALDDPNVAGANLTGSAPTEIHLTPAGQNAMYVMWASSNYTVGQGTLSPLDVSKSASVVKYGTSASNLSMQSTGIVEIYNQIYNTTGPASTGLTTAVNYTSPYLHAVILSNLTPATTYYYQVGDGTTFSATYNFTSLQKLGSYPQRIIALADWGASHNSTVTLQHALYSAANGGVAPVAHYIGDFCYADTWHANGSVSLPTSGYEGLASSSYAPVWDLWQRMIQPLVSNVPMLTCTGNHEIEQQDDANFTTFKSVQTRWKVPSSQSGSDSYFFYSQEYGPVHSIFLSVYTDYTPGSDQWNWLSLDLLSVNRTLTPWIIVNFHNPIYTTDPSYKEFEQLRVSMEPLFYQAGVDVVYFGHVHSFEQTYPVYNYNLNPCGTSYITIGDAGNTEGLSFLTNDGTQLEFEDLHGGCPNITTTRPSYMYSTNPSVNDPFYYYKRTLTFQADGNSTGYASQNYPNGYCYNSQPDWSAFREPSFGHGTLDIINSTHALSQWWRNQNSVSVPSYAVYIVRDTAKCANKMYPMDRMTNGGMWIANEPAPTS